MRSIDRKLRYLYLPMFSVELESKCNVRLVYIWSMKIAFNSLSSCVTAMMTMDLAMAMTQWMTGVTEGVEAWALDLAWVWVWAEFQCGGCVVGGHSLSWSLPTGLCDPVFSFTQCSVVVFSCVEIFSSFLSGILHNSFLWGVHFSRTQQACFDTLSKTH